MENETPERPGVRLAKVIALRGLSSRRGAEDLVREGRVTVNGEVVTELATLVDPMKDAIRIDGHGLPPEPKKVYYLCYKPRGVLTARDEEKNRPSVANLVENLNLKGGVEPVGKLEFNTEGALLLTNDGELAHKLTHPSVQVPRRYLAKVYRTPSPNALKAIERGVVAKDEKFLAAKARVVDQTDGENAWIEVTIVQSGQQVVARMLAAIGHPVSKLRRESFGTVSIRGMERGTVRPLTVAELGRLRDIASGVKPQKAGKDWRGKGFAKPKTDKKRPPRSTTKPRLTKDSKSAAKGSKSAAKPRTAPRKKPAPRDA